jgi:hypothetical protein
MKKTVFYLPWVFTFGIIMAGLAACNGLAPPTEVPLVVQNPDELSQAPVPPDAGQPKQLDSEAQPSPISKDPSPIPPTVSELNGAGAVPSTLTPIPTEPASEINVFTPSDEPLRASDPADFSLASGDVQLVEFFAFW